MPNESGFVDFKQYSDLNSEEESRRLQEALDAAEAADGVAQKSLMVAGRSAVGGDVTQSANYSDYLVAKQNASKAWAAANMTSSDPRMAGLRKSLNTQSNVAGQGAASGEELTRREGVFAKRASDGYAESLRYKAANEAYYGKQKADKEEREKVDKAAYRDYRMGWLTKGARGRAAERGSLPTAYDNTFDSGTQSQAADEVAELLGMGGTEEQARAIWNEYAGWGKDSISPFDVKPGQAAARQNYTNQLAAARARQASKGVGK